MAFLNQSELLTELQSVICTVKGGLTLKELEIKFLKLTNYSLPPEFKSLKTLHSIWPGFFEIKR